jgi:hypothetical protein
LARTVGARGAVLPEPHEGSRGDSRPGKLN